MVNNDIDWLNEVIEMHGKTPSALIPVLQSVQKKYRYVPENIMEYIADKTGTTLANVYGVVTFYSQFSLEPKGEHIIQICDGTACHVRGAKETITRIRKGFGLSEEQNTTDDKFLTLEIVACIGACAMAPAVIIDGKVYGHVQPEEIVKVLKGFKNKES